MDHETRQALLSLSLLMRKNKEKAERAKKSNDPRRVEYADIPPVTPLEPVPKKYMATAPETLTIRELNSLPVNLAAQKVMGEKDLPYDLDEEVAVLTLATHAALEHEGFPAEEDFSLMLVGTLKQKEELVKNLQKLNLDWESEWESLLETGVDEGTPFDLLVEAWPDREGLSTHHPPEDWTR